MSAGVQTILGPDGPIARALEERFESRPEQIQMARAVAGAMQSGTHLFVEAGTGVGKSFAYLVPAMLRCLNHRETIVVATNTIALQEQLVERDIPLLIATLGSAPGPGAPGADSDAWAGSIRPVLVKGRGNYLSIRRLQLASARQARLLPDEASRRTLHQIEQWAYATSDGTLSTLGPMDRPGVWDRVQSDSGNCMGRRCPQYQRCFYQSARRRMEGANLLVCNHALFFSDLALRVKGHGFLPRYDHVILDEAHHAEDVASDHFGMTLSEGGVRHLLDTLFQPRSGKGYLTMLRVAGADDQAARQAVGQTRAAAEAAGFFFGALIDLHESIPGSSGRIREPGAIPNELTGAMRDLAILLARLRDNVSSEPDRFELNAYAERATEIADTAEALVDQSVQGCAYWVEITRTYRGRPRVRLACSPIEVGPILRRVLFEDGPGVILTSATLGTDSSDDGDPFAHIKTRLGCEHAKTLLLGSPFDHAAQVRLIVDRSVPDPKRGGSGSPAYLDALCARISHHVLDSDGGAFVLFTSFATLNAVADRIGPDLEARGLRVLVQGRSGPRLEILERFRLCPRAVLLGAASFWQGVDVPGPNLRNVIITRLPFEPPDRPIVEARLERIAERGGNPFFEDSLPRAIIRFKQGYGRLIRSATDSGRVVVLDPRIRTARYGRLFLRALPEGVPVEEIPAAAGDRSPALD